MPGKTLRGIRACVFDAYGTLFNVDSATRPFTAELGGRALALNRLWREKQLNYSWLRAVQGVHVDFWQVTADALDFALDSVGAAGPVLRDRLMDQYLTLDAFPDVYDSLCRLKKSGFELAILSNGTPVMLETAVQHAGLGVFFSNVLSVEAAGVYKPHSRVYQLAVDRLCLRKQEIAFVSSNGWDVHAGSAFGLRAIWCNRESRIPERLPGQPELVLKSLGELPGCLSAEPSVS